MRINSSKGLILMMLFSVLTVGANECNIFGTSTSDGDGDGDVDGDSDVDGDGDSDGRSCAWPTFECAPLGCVLGGYCCTFTPGTNTCYSTYSEAEDWCNGPIYECGVTGDECEPGWILVSWDAAPAICSMECDYHYECPSGYCAPLSGGGNACAPDTSVSDCSPSCDSDQICVSFPDGSYSCGDICWSNSECFSNCCAELDDGSSACVPSNYCGSSCTPNCAGRSCGDDDGCGGTCDGPCESSYLDCVLYLDTDEPFHYCTQLCEVDYDCCEGSAPGAVRDGGWCCIPYYLTPSRQNVCGWNASYPCPHYSHDPCGG